MRGFLTGLCCVVVAAAVATGAPLQDTLAVVDLDDSSTSGSANETCFLNQFRSFNRKQAKEQGIKFSHEIEKHMTWGSVTFSLVCLVAGTLLLFVGWKLAEVIFLVTGFGTGAVLTFWATSAVMNATGWFNCWALGIAPLVGGIVGAAILHKIEKLSLFLLGAGLGATLGYYVWILVLVNMETKVKWIGNNHELVYIGVLVVPALICGYVAVKIEKKILAVATSLIGGMLSMAGIVYLVLVRINPRFGNWIQPCMFNPDHPCTHDFKVIKYDAFVLGPVIGAAVLSIVGLVVQLRLQRKKKDAYEPIPYGGFGSTQYQ